MRKARDSMRNFIYIRHCAFAILTLALVDVIPCSFGAEFGFRTVFEAVPDQPTVQTALTLKERFSSRQEGFAFDSLSLTHDNRYLAVGNDGGKVFIWDISSKKKTI